MRILQDLTLVLSQDNIATPVNVLFSAVLEVADTTSLTKAKTVNEVFPIGDTVISLGTITTGKFLYVKPTTNVVIDLGNGPITFLAGKQSVLWTTFTEITVTVSGATNDVFLAIGGV